MLEGSSEVSSSTQEQLDLLAEIESRDNIFSEIDFRVYSSLAR